MSATSDVSHEAPATEPSRERPAARRSAGQWVADHAQAQALVVLTGAVVVFFSLYGSTRDIFPTAANFQATTGSQAVLAIVALGALIPLVCEQYDLSVGGILGVTAVYSASVLSSGAPIFVAVLLAIAIGALIGAINGLLVTRARVNAVIATLGVATALEGVMIWKTNGLAIVHNIPTSLVDFGSGNTFGIPRTLFVVAGVTAVVYYVLQHTPLGRYLYMLGSNPGAARLVGLNAKGLLLTSFVASGALCGVAGVLQVAVGGGADPRIGATFTLPALAAAFLSAAAIRPGRYNVGGTIVAIFFLAALNSGLNLAGAEPFVNSFVNGAALVVGVALAGFLGRKRATT